MCTHPETIRAVIREVKRPTLSALSSPGGRRRGCDTDECYEACGIAAVAREEGVELVDIKKDKDLINGSRAGLPLQHQPRQAAPPLLLEAEHIINLPILKAHASMVFSGALKNIKGVVQDQVHVQMHQQNLTMGHDGRVVGLPRRHQHHGRDARRQRLLPHTPVPIEVDCIMGSYDPVALDRIACELVGIDPDGVDYFRVWPGHHQPRRYRGGGRQGGRLLQEDVGPLPEDIRNRWPEYEVHCEAPAPAVRPC